MIKNVIISLMLIIALYFGSGGFIILENEQKYERAIVLPEKTAKYKGIPFYNKEVMLTAKEQELITKIYPYSKRIPSTLSFILTAMAFGLIGSLSKLINQCLSDKTKLSETENLFLIPFQGALIGLIILGISYTIPTFLTNESGSLKPITVVLLSLFGGIYYKNFYTWLSSLIKKTIFKPT